MIHPWLQEVWQRLRAAEARLPHALLFIGPPGLGKRDLAEALAARLLCAAPAADGHACGACPACRLRLSGNHPDLLRVVPESEAASEIVEGGEGGQKSDKAEKAKSMQIRIEQIRDLQQALMVTGHQSERRVILLAPAEAMNVFTANALLKLLEEPPTGCTFILLSDEPLRLLATIRSRCQLWRLSPPDGDALTRWRQTHPAVAEELLSVSGGMPLDALRLAERGGGPLLNRFIRDVSEMAQRDPLKLAGQWESWIKSKEAQAAGFGLPELIDWMQRWVCDFAALRLGGQVRYFPQARSVFERLCRYASVAAALTCYNEFNQIRKVARHPLNARLALEDMLMRYARAVTGSQT